MKERKRLIRQEYIKIQEELNGFIEYYSTEALGWDEGLILSPESKKEYLLLKEKIVNLKNEYKELKYGERGT